MYAPLANVRVHDIIEPTTKIWKASLVYNIFDKNTAHLILNTPLQFLVSEYKFIWKAEKVVIILFVVHIEFVLLIL